MREGLSDEAVKGVLGAKRDASEYRDLTMRRVVGVNLDGIDAPIAVAVSPKVLNEHAATIYRGPFADSQGARLRPGKTYRLHVPADTPVAQFWSLTIYDQATWAFIYTPEMRPGISSFDKGNLNMNTNGSVDLYFGPKTPDGLQANWIPTRGRTPYPLFRFYGPTAAFWDKSFTMPDVELVQ